MQFAVFYASNMGLGDNYLVYETIVIFWWYLVHGMFQMHGLVLQSLFWFDCELQKKQITIESISISERKRQNTY